MKNMRKIASLLLALIMVFSLSIAAYATGNTSEPVVHSGTHSIIINSNHEGHTYEAYQIFTGDFVLKDGTQKTLSNIKWGCNALDKTAGDPVGEEIFEHFDANEAISLVNFSSTPFATSSDYDAANKQYVISGLPSGYYLLKDKDNSLQGDHASYTSFILELVEDSIITPKSSAPRIEKKVEDKNDTLARTSEWQDSADYDIDDEIRFQLVANLADNVTTYKDDYYLAFHDTLSEGLTYVPDSVQLMVDGPTPINPDKYHVSITGQNLTITIDDATDIGATNNSVVTVIYNAKLNEKAKIGSEGNPNTVYLEYANNPHWEGEGKPATGETPDDKVIVFTYKLVVDKIHKTGTNENKEPIYEALSGAGFTLYKKDGISAAYLPVGEELSGGAMTKFTWNGLDDGDYMLKETTTPSGYNTIDPIYFTIAADHDTILDDTLTLNSLTGNVTSGEAEFTANLSDGSLKTEVINQQGVKLPETGGMGTTLIYVVGGIMVLAAVVLLVTKKRMASAE